MAFTPEVEIPQLVEKARATFASGKTRPIQWRLKQIEQIYKMIVENEDEWKRALTEDLGVNEFWTKNVEISGVRGESKTALRNLSKWMKPEKVSTPAVMAPGDSYIQREPFGTTLIIAPWNYPLTLVLNPMIAAIAAGNTVIFKPSELSANTAGMFQRLVPRYLDNEAIIGVWGGPKETQKLLDIRFDFICYTGSTQVGKIVAEAAARNLTPVLLELGGKCPAIVAPDADLVKSAKRICWGKFTLNMGQTCLSPDYILTTRDVESKLIYTLKATLKEFYGENPKDSKDVSRIINERHTRRIAELLEQKGLELITGGPAQVDITARYIAPAIVRCTFDHPIMREEIFGPILPILVVDNIDSAIQYINSKEKPLAIYVFSESRATQQKVITSTSSGAACANDCVLQSGSPYLPFGGVGHSGMGSYHGKFGFDQFSHKKAVLIKKGQDLSIRFPPYTASKLLWLTRLSNPAFLKMILGAGGTLAVIAIAIAIKYFWK